MNTGWIRLYRKLLKNAIWKSCNNAQKVVFITLLLEANHTEQKVIINDKEITVKEGSLFTSIEHIKRLCGKEVSERQVRYALVKLQKLGFLSYRSSNDGTYITIEKWAMYQGMCESNVTEFVTRLSDDCNTSVTPLSTNKNEIIKNEECNNIFGDVNITRQDDASHDIKFKLSSSDIEQVKKAWNMLEGISELKVLKPDTKRGRMLQARVKDYGVDDVIKAIGNISNSSFLRGLKTDWKITFDWFVKPNNFIKVLENQYADNKNNGGSKDVYNNERSTREPREKSPEWYKQNYNLPDEDVPF